MNTQQNKNEQIQNAILFGRTANMENQMCLPCQDTNFVEFLKSHRADIQDNASFNELMEAWISGWNLQNKEY